MSATLEKALVLIEAMARSSQPCGVTQLSRELKMNKSTVYRLLDILCRRGFARQDPVHKQYMLTTRLWELGVGVLETLSVNTVAPPLLREAAEATGETLLLAIPADGQALIIDRVNSGHALQIVSQIGSRVPLHCSSLGKALMIDWTEAQLRGHGVEGRSQLTPNTLTTTEALLEQVAQARRTGYAVAVEEFNLGVSGVAAPVRDATGAVVASVGISGPILRLAADRLAGLGAQAVEVATRISQVLGHGARPAA